MLLSSAFFSPLSLSLSLSYLRLPHLLSSSFHFFFPPPISLVSFSDFTHSYTLRLSSFHPRFCTRALPTLSLSLSLSHSRSRSLSVSIFSFTHENPRSIHAVSMRPNTHSLARSFSRHFNIFFFFFLLHSVLFVRRSERLYIFTGILLVVVYSPPSRGNVSSSHHVYLFLFFSFFFSPFFFLFLFFFFCSSSFLHLLFHLNIGKLDIVSQSLSIFFLFFVFSFLFCFVLFYFILFCFVLFYFVTFLLLIWSSNRTSSNPCVRARFFFLLPFF